MFIAVIDTETTGDSETDQVLEIAVVPVTVRSGVPTLRRGNYQLIRPSCPVSPVARAVHHITDEELSSAPSMEELASRRMSILRQIGGADYVAAHFVEFDSRLLEQSGFAHGKPRVCTWRCARHLWPDAPAYGNQVLRYWRDVVVQRTPLPPHRAIFDALTTAALLANMLLTEPIDRLEKLTRTPVLLTKIKFGQYRGQTWREVRLRDRGYLSWILRQDFGEDEKHTAQHWLSRRKEEIDAEQDGNGAVLQVRESETRDISETAGDVGQPDAGSDLPEV